MADMPMQTCLRAGSPCRQAATEIMEDLSMETGLNDEAYRRDMINIFPGHPALPQQTHSLQGNRTLETQRNLNAPAVTMIGNFGPQSNGLAYLSHSTEEDELTVEDQTLATEPDWITQMLEQVQRVGLWNDPIPDEPARASEMPQATAGLQVKQPVPPTHVNDTDPIPFYRANMESLLANPVTQQNLPQLAGSEASLGAVPCPSLGAVIDRFKPELHPAVQSGPPVDPARPVALPSQEGPSQEGGMGLIGQNLSTQSVDYLHLIRNALNVPGLASSNAAQAQPSKLKRQPTVSLELSNDGMREVLASTRQEHLNDGPFRPPTSAPSRHALASMRPLNSKMAHPVLQQSKLQLELGLAADAPIDLRNWGYGGGSYHADEANMQLLGKQSYSSGGMHAVASSADVSCSIAAKSGPLVMSGNPSHLLHSRPDVSGCTTADSLISAGRASQANQNGADRKQKSLNSESAERVTQASDRKSGLSADEVTRLESLERYREKKRRRLYTKTIRYHKRKVNADARKRYKGRFVKAETSGPDASKDSAEQATDPGHRKVAESMGFSDMQTI